MDLLAIVQASEVFMDLGDVGMNVCLVVWIVVVISFEDMDGGVEGVVSSEDVDD